MTELKKLVRRLKMSMRKRADIIMLALSRCGYINPYKYYCKHSEEAIGIG